MPSRSLHPAVVAGAVVALSLTLLPQRSWTHELATASGAITTHDPAAGERIPTCRELVVEARDGLDNHLIGRAQPVAGDDGSCRYAISVPAQSAVWLRLRPVLVDDARAFGPGTATAAAPVSTRAVSSRSVQLRFTIIAPTTFFFAPGEQKTVPLTY